MDDARALLDRIPELQRPCDLDLLMFFAKHPRTLIAGEQLAQLLGYQLSEIARSRDVLLAAGFLTRIHNPTRRPRLYVFATGDEDGRSVPALVALASTREGRLALRQVLASAPAAVADSSRSRAGDGETALPAAGPASA
jgi:hypothetical protein